ncbi:prepilin-type N-terminal cleavage/methylation domain-containing protein [Janthinobacterium tructae]|uniref:Prepilin-type N-terminal cleavage/methylation domain-containing protein n=2 Tax=Janthinobacterium tructae TaxID=2590869 RepID=A0A4Y6RMV2_9BURK|nr:prepilin-type N-terminal cleavage/methylation domain-containing protein [Janthinobacterium tructae]
MHARLRQHRGMSLLELLVALSLGALLMLAASSVLLAASGSYGDQSASARLDDNGRYALDTIARAVRQTAYVNWDSSAAPVAHAAHDSANIAGLDAHSLGKNSEGISGALPGALHGSDVLALRYYGAGKEEGGDGSVLNCAGFGVGAAQTQAQRGWSIFYVAQGADGEGELRCKYRGANGWGADAIIRGVDGFQVLYGLDTDTPPDGVANRYLNASALDAYDAALVLVGADAAARQRDLHSRTHWKRVAGVRVALLLHGEAGQADKMAELGPAQFDLFGKGYAEAHGAGDMGVRIARTALPIATRSRLRQLVQTSIMLRNGPV